MINVRMYTNATGCLVQRAMNTFLLLIKATLQLEEVSTTYPGFSNTSIANTSIKGTCAFTVSST